MWLLFSRGVALLAQQAGELCVYRGVFVGVTDELQPVAPLADDLGGSTVSRGIATMPASERAHAIDDDERSDLSDVDACRAPGDE